MGGGSGGAARRGGRGGGAERARRPRKRRCAGGTLVAAERMSHGGAPPGTPPPTPPPVPPPVPPPLTSGRRRPHRAAGAERNPEQRRRSPRGVKRLRWVRPPPHPKRTAEHRHRQRLGGERGAGGGAAVRGGVLEAHLLGGGHGIGAPIHPDHSGSSRSPPSLNRPPRTADLPGCPATTPPPPQDRNRSGLGRPHGGEAPPTSWRPRPLFAGHVPLSH